MVVITFPAMYHILSTNIFFGLVYRKSSCPIKIDAGEHRGGRKPKEEGGTSKYSPEISCASHQSLFLSHHDDEHYSRTKSHWLAGIKKLYLVPVFAV